FERWNCFAGCGQGDAIDFLAKVRGVSKGDACREFIALAGVSAPQPPARTQPGAPLAESDFDWPRCVTGLSSEKRVALARWRGLSPEFIDWLHGQHLVGAFNENCVAFPITDRSGRVTGCHYRLDDGTWRYHPRGCRTSALAVGDFSSAKRIF